MKLTDSRFTVWVRFGTAARRSDPRESGPQTTQVWSQRARSRCGGMRKSFPLIFVSEAGVQQVVHALEFAPPARHGIEYQAAHEAHDCHEHQSRGKHGGRAARYEAGRKEVEQQRNRQNYRRQRENAADGYEERQRPFFFHETRNGAQDPPAIAPGVELAGRSSRTRTIGSADFRNRYA